MRKIIDNLLYLPQGTLFFCNVNAQVPQEYMNELKSHLNEKDLEDMKVSKIKMPKRIDNYNVYPKNMKSLFRWVKSQKLQN